MLMNVFSPYKCLPYSQRVRLIFHLAESNMDYETHAVKCIHPPNASAYICSNLLQLKEVECIHNIAHLMGFTV